MGAADIFPVPDMAPDDEPKRTAADALVVITRRYLPVGNLRIAALARKTHTAQDVVKHLYDQEIALLHAEAAVKNFIGIIAGRRVKRRLNALKSTAQSLQGPRRTL
jgi:hypothetical protein